MKTLVIGGSGFVSGTLSRMAVQAGHQVWAVTRGQKPLPPGITAIEADRTNRAEFAAAIAQAGQEWDLVVDCIGFQPEDARQDLAVFQGKARHLIFVSTDFVFDPARRDFPQSEENPHYLSDGYGGNKRL